jgi:hypothetical protein
LVYASQYFNVFVIQWIIKWIFMDLRCFYDLGGSFLAPYQTVPWSVFSFFLACHLRRFIGFVIAPD